MNRPTETVDLSTRELLWKLPELLEGDEPVLSRPAVREHLTRDPEARLAIVAVAELSRALATGRRAALLPASRSEALRGPAAAVRHFRHQLSRLLFDCGLVHFNEGTRGRAAYSSQLLTLSVPPPSVRREAFERVAQALGVEPRSIGVEVDTFTALAATSGPPLELARRQWQTCDSLTPELEYVRFNLRLAEEELGRAKDLGYWLAVARDTRSLLTRSGALLFGAHAANEVGDVRLALELTRSARDLNAESPLNHYYLLHYGLAFGDDKEVVAGADGLTRVTTHHPPLQELVARQVGADAETWSSLRRMRAPLVTKLTRTAPTWLSEAIERPIQ